MNQVKRSRRQQCTTIQDVPEELIQHIQSLLPLEEAPRTSVLSKSWLHAWSTIPTLRFYRPSRLNETKYIKLINRTLRRYRGDNIPVETFDLDFDVHDLKTVSRAHNWLRKVASMTCLKELYLCISLNSSNIASYTLPDQLFSGEKLNTISVKSEQGQDANLLRLHISANTVIKCVNLRVLELIRVHISEEVLDNVLSTCNLLEKVHLCDLNLRTLKVNNLRNLHSFKIASIYTHSLEVYQVPNLVSLTFGASSYDSILPSFNIDFLGSVTTLILDGSWIMNDAVFNMIKSSFPFLLYLTLRMKSCKLTVLDITCLSLKRLIIELMENEQIDIPIYAPELLYFRYSGKAMPTLFINPTTTPPLQIELELIIPNRKPIYDHLVFLKLREALNVPSKFNISITTHDYHTSGRTFNGDDNIRRRIPLPATNVQQLSFSTYTDQMWSGETAAIYDGFIWVCHPNYVQVTIGYTGYLGKYGRHKYNNENSWKRLISFMMEMKTRKEENWPDLKDVEIKDPVNGNWETLTSSWIDYNEIFNPRCHLYKRGSFSVKFKLTWFSL